MTGSRAIQSYFPKTKASSGASSKFNAQNSKDAPVSNEPSPFSFEGAWSPSNTYTYRSIDTLTVTASRIYITGRVANLSHYTTNTKSESNAKFRLQLLIRDETAAIEVKLWHTTPLPSDAMLELGTLVSVYTNSVGGKENGVDSKGGVKGLTVTLSEWDTAARLVVLREDSEERQNAFRSPVKALANGVLNGLVPLSSLHEGGRTLVCVKSIGALRKVTTKNGRQSEKVDVGIFDDTKDEGAQLILWGVAAYSAKYWKPSETILLISNPSLGTYSGSTRLSLGKETMLDVDPNLRDAIWLRDFAVKRMASTMVGQKFPIDLFYNEFDPAGIPYCTFGTIDKLFRKNMLFCGTCCGVPTYTNEKSITCKNCEKETELVLNSKIIESLADETGTVQGSKLLISDRAWSSLLGVEPVELKNVEFEKLKNLEEYMLYLRVTATVVYSKSNQRIAVWDFNS